MGAAKKSRTCEQARRGGKGEVGECAQGRPVRVACTVPNLGAVGQGAALCHAKLLQAVHLVNRVLLHSGSDALDPLFHFCAVGRLDLIRRVLAQHDLPLAVRLGSLDGQRSLCASLTHGGLLGDNLEAVLPLGIGALSDVQAFEGNGPLWLDRLGRLEVVEAVVGESEPPSLPGFVLPTLFLEPASPFGVEEGVGQPGLFLWKLKRRRRDRVEKISQELWGQVLPLVDASVHRNERLQCLLVLHRGVVHPRVEHDRRKSQDVARVLVAELSSVALHVSLCKCHHESVDRLGFSWQPKAPQVRTERLVKIHVLKIVKPAKGVENVGHVGPETRVLAQDLTCRPLL
eukprot:m.415372 g.415372  ORF g.415372 m.415372 type:complete len:344 (+) comp29599_c0_seq1:124-1155(+)